MELSNLSFQNRRADRWKSPRQRWNPPRWRNSAYRSSSSRVESRPDCGIRKRRCLETHPPHPSSPSSRRRLPLSLRPIAPRLLSIPFRLKGLLVLPAPFPFLVIIHHFLPHQIPVHALARLSSFPPSCTHALPSTRSHLEPTAKISPSSLPSTPINPSLPRYRPRRLSRPPFRWSLRSRPPTTLCGSG
ncbi:hypothetical protein BHM03_00058074 [Ensete ventricosum]|nr:hypothetical protein BHM03_00058074 [Ensete ventricosum]